MTDSRRYEIKVCPKCGQQTDRWCYEHGLDMIAGERIEVVPAEQLTRAVEGYERVALLAGWIERDRREPDKVLMYAQELANLATAHVRQS